MSNTSDETKPTEKKAFKKKCKGRKRQESMEQREIRLEKQRNYKHMSLCRETSEQRERRLAADRARKALHRAREDKKINAYKLASDAALNVVKRSMENTVTRAAMIKAEKALKKANRLFHESIKKRNARLEAAKLRKRTIRATESAEARTARLAKERAMRAKSRARQDEKKRAAILEADRNRKKAKRNEERVARLDRERPQRAEDSRCDLAPFNQPAYPQIRHYIRMTIKPDDSTDEVARAVKKEEPIDPSNEVDKMVVEVELIGSPENRSIKTEPVDPLEVKNEPMLIKVELIDFPNTPLEDSAYRYPATAAQPVLKTEPIDVPIESSSGCQIEPDLLTIKHAKAFKQFIC